MYMIREHTSHANSDETGNYKIGFAGSPDKRISDLRAGNSRSLVFVHKSEVQDMRAAEKAMHTALASYRIPRRQQAGTEWFDASSNFQQFNQTYIKIAEQYKAKSLSHLVGAGFIDHSQREAKNANERAL